MSKLVAVQGCTIKYETTPSGSVELSVTIVPATSKSSSGGNKAHSDKITINVLSGTVNLDSPPTPTTPPASSGQGVVPPGVIQISGTAQKADTEGKPFVLKDDNGSSVFTCVFPSEASPYTTSYPVTIKATVDDPGQNVIKVN